VIPKTMHWCWFSEQPLTDRVKACQETWKQFFPQPEWEWKMWTIDAVQEAAKDLGVTIPTIFWDAINYKRWAVAADYIRLFAVYRYGGIYLDSDVLQYKPIPEGMLNHRCILFIEDFVENPCADIQAAYFGAESSHPYIRACMEKYESIEGTEYDGILASRIIAPSILRNVAQDKYGMSLARRNNVIQALPEGIHVYPWDTVAGFADQVTGNSIALHICDGSWRRPQYNGKLLIGVPTSGYILPQTIESIYNLTLRKAI